MLSELGTSSLDYTEKEDTVVEHINLCLILSYFLSPEDEKNINACRKFLNYFHAMVLHMKPEIIHNFIQHDPDYVPQTIMAMERRTQFLFLVVIQRTCIPSIAFSLT